MGNFKTYTLILFLFGITNSLLFAQQNGQIHGKITNQQGLSVENATVRIGDYPEMQTDHEGKFRLLNAAPGRYRISVTATGFDVASDSIRKIVDENLYVEISLQNSLAIIDQVSVEGFSESQRAANQPIKTTIVDTKEVAEQPVTLAELMNRSSGIRIRQSGGLGRDVEVSINGFQGNSVQYFRDGIPLEYLSGGYGLNNVPVNQLDRVEIYKGVIPIALGGDALGGAVNLITKKSYGTQVSSSYEIASFNTHIANLNIYHQKRDSKWFFGTDAFFNYSKNNYKADIEVVENSKYVPATVELFNNAFRHYFMEVYGGLRDVKWADELKIGIAAFDIYRESQHPALMTNPYGAIHTFNKAIVPSVRYKKSLLDNKLDFDVFASLSANNRGRVDTAHGTYDWYGNFTPRQNGLVGESPNPSNSDINFKQMIARANVAYKIDESNQLAFNYVWNYNSRLGSDPLGFRFEGTDIDVLSKKAEYDKQVAAISWDSQWLNGRLTNQFFGKYFKYSSTGINAFRANDTDLDKFETTSNDNWGIGNAIKYQLNQKSVVRLSAELTNRLPRSEELFGDFDTRAPNFNLAPEKSLNANLSYNFTDPRYSIGANAFYRKTRGMILLVPIQAPFAQYQNLDSIRGIGIDIDASYMITKNIRLSGNVTYQDNRMVDIETPLYKWIEGTRLRNTPYFFANLAMQGNFGNVLSSGDRLKPYVHYNFIREFYLNPIPRDQEPGGFLGLFGNSNVDVKDLIPDQSLISAGINYVLPNSKIAIGAEVKNIADAKLYDYYKVQRPGRSFHLKINYNFNKS